MLSNRHVGAAAGLHGEAHDLAFHEDEQQHEDLDPAGGTGGQRTELCPRPPHNQPHTLPQTPVVSGPRSAHPEPHGHPGQPHKHPPAGCRGPSPTSSPCPTAAVGLGPCRTLQAPNPAPQVPCACSPRTPQDVSHGSLTQCWGPPPPGTGRWDPWDPHTPSVRPHRDQDPQGPRDRTHGTPKHPVPGPTGIPRHPWTRTPSPTGTPGDPQTPQCPAQGDPQTPAAGPTGTGTYGTHG